MHKFLFAIALGALSACGHGEESEEETFTEPSLELTTPTQAAWLPAGPSDVTGKAIGLDDVTLDGEPVTVAPDGSFTASRNFPRGMSSFEVKGFDERGDHHYLRRTVIAGDFDEPGQLLENAAYLRVNRSGLDQLMGIVEGMMADIDLGKKASAANPVYEDSYGVFGWDAVTIMADVTDVRAGAISVEAVPASGVLELTAVLPALELDVLAYGDIIGIDFDTEAWFWADSAVVTGMLTTDVEDGNIVVELHNPAIDLIGFGYDTSLIPGDVEEYLFVESIEEYLEDSVVEMITEMVPDMVEDLLGSVDLSFEADLLGNTVSIEAAFASATIDLEGLQLVVDMTVDLPGTGSQTFAGYLSTGDVMPDLDRSAHVSAAIADNLMNYALFEAWSAGLLDMRMSTDDGSLDSFMLAPLRAEEGTITTAASLPPVILEDAGELLAQIGGLGIAIETPGGEMGENMTLDVTAELNIAVEIDGSDVALLLGTPEVGLMVTDNDWGASNEALTQLVTEMLPIEMLLLLLPDMTFPIPEIDGLSIATAEVQRDQSGAFTEIVLFLQ